MSSNAINILSLGSYSYYGIPAGIEPQFYYLYTIPKQMGYTIDFMDIRSLHRRDPDNMRSLLMNLVKSGKYSHTFVATFQDELSQDYLDELRKHTITIAWNSDDEWRWDDYSSHYINHYDFMVSNSKQIYDQYRSQYNNLLYAQWACTGLWDGRNTPKDIPFSFAGKIYGTRAQEVLSLSKRVALKPYGLGTAELGYIKDRGYLRSKLRRHTIIPLLNKLDSDRLKRPLHFNQINEIWNRSQISFTPLASSQHGQEIMQVKSRVFDMGLSGTVMLSDKNPAVHDYYEPGKEYLEFESLDECVDLVRALSKDPQRRQAIADAYTKRTLAEHMWEHRIQHVMDAATA